MALLASLVVLNWQDEASTIRCVASLRGLDRASDSEIIVVDNASTAASREALSSLGVRVIPLPTNRGFAGGMNAGIEAARGTYIGLFNNDVLVDRAWLAEALHVMEDSSVGLVGGHAIEWDGSDDLTRQGAALAMIKVDPTRGFGVLGPAPPWECRVPGLDGSNLLARADLLRRLGGFDEAYFAYHEDIDLSARVSNHGFDLVLTPAMKVLHQRGHSSDDVPYRRAFWAARNQCFTIAKHFPAGSWSSTVARVTVDNLIAAILGTRSGLRGRETSPVIGWHTRIGLAVGAAWVATHPRTLIRMRRRAIADGHHAEEYAARLRRFSEGAPRPGGHRGHGNATT